MRKSLLRLGCLLLFLAAVLPADGLARAVYLNPLPASQVAAPLPWDEYWQRIADTLQSVLDCKDLTPDQASARLKKLAVQWEAVKSIELPDGKVAAIDQSYLIAQLKQDPPELDSLDQLLGVMLAERDSLAQTLSVTADPAGLSRILARQEFQWKDRITEPNALQKLWQRIQAALDRLAQTIFGFQGGDYIFGAGALIVFIAMVLYLLRNLLFGFVAESRLAPRVRAGSEELTADSALAAAQNLSQGGDYRSAVRYLYLSALLLLEERGLLVYDRTRTNREYLRSVSGYPELETSLRFVVEVFDRVWYGYQPLEDRDYQFYERQVGKLRQQRSNLQTRPDGS